MWGQAGQWVNQGAKQLWAWLADEGGKKAVKGAGKAAGGAVGAEGAKKGRQWWEERSAARGVDKGNRKLANMLAASHAGWKYTEGTVVANRHRFIVWDDKLQPMAAFPEVEGAGTPELLAKRWELKDFDFTAHPLRNPSPQR